MAFQLRNYQQHCVEKIVWAMQLSGNDLVCLPTGAGKSIVIAEVVNRLQRKAIILQPSKEILAQNVAKLSRYVPAHEIGVYSASMNSRTVRKYTFATIQSVYKKPYLFEDCGWALVDEAHGVNQKNADSMFASFFEAIHHPKVTGLTATPYRNVMGVHDYGNGNYVSQMTLKLMVRMKPKFWDRMLFNVNPGDLVDAGHLVPLKYIDRSIIQHEMIPINRSHSDYDMEAYGKAIMPSEAKIMGDIRILQQQHKSVLVFCPTVAMAHQMGHALDGAASVSGTTPAKDRDRIIEGFKSGRIKTVFNVGVLTTGFDHPALDCIVLIRPTKSLALYYQMLGRGVRLFPGKEFCTVYDYSGTYAQMGTIESIRLVKEQQPQFQNPVWELKTDAVEHWHNRPLYSYATKTKSANIDYDIHLGKLTL